MTTATEFLDAFNNAFVNKHRSYLDLILADNCKIHFTDLNETMTRQETLDWSETGICSGIEHIGSSTCRYRCDRCSEALQAAPKRA